MNPASFRGWTPIRIYPGADGLMVDWCHLGEQRFVEPFFDQSVSGALRNPAQRLFRRQTPIAFLADFARECPGLPPSALIYHLSRSGSTLVTQMLAQIPHNLVVSDAPPLDRVINAQLHDHAVTDEQRILWLRGLVSALGQPRHGETRFFLKLDSWHILQLPLIQRAFPTVPWIFLYRDPLDVLLSHHQVRGTQVLPGVLPAGLFDLDPPWAPPATFDDYAARVIAQLAQAAIRHTTAGRGRFVHYTELPGAVEELCNFFFDTRLVPTEVAAMQQALPFHAKHPHLPFVDATAARRAAAGPELLALAQTWLAEPYVRLEAIRLSQPPLHRT
ncbi:MAG: sulfotransferase family protein [Verrucomicrobia bacterium]|nr:sulfotransferase family protein [Verrucomicrobiota bacterium]